MAVGPRILALPMEMLQQISIYSGPSDLLPLRLTCKRLGAAVFDAFAAEYIQDLRCYVMDPARLARLEAICSTESLIDAVQNVKFTMDGLEGMGWRDIHVVPEEHDLTIEYAQIWVHGLIRDEMYERFLHKRPDVARLSTVFDKLAKQGCAVNIDLSDYLDGEAHDCHAHDILIAIGRASCPISRLRLVEGSMSYLELLIGQGQTPFTKALSTLRDFAFSAYRYGLGDPRSPDSLDSLKAILRSATQLEELHLGLNPPRGSTGYSFLRGAAADLILSSALGYVRKLSL